MEEKKMNQEQSQNVNVSHDEHGMIATVICEYRSADPGRDDFAFAKAQMFNAVKVLVYKGETIRVYCNYYDNGACKSSHNKTQDKKCYIKAN